jgi:hypothetical protein
MAGRDFFAFFRDRSAAGAAVFIATDGLNGNNPGFI